MLTKESTFIDDDKNGLRIDKADEDGIQIVEHDNESAVYVYISEIPKLMGVLQEYYDKYR